MNIIDALTVTLGLDAKDYKKERKEVQKDLKELSAESQKRAKEMEASFTKFGDSLRTTKNHLLGLLGVFGAAMGFKEFITSSITGQAALGRLSDTLNISARNLEAWGVVAQEMGGTTQDAFSALQNVANGVAEAMIKGHSAFTDVARSNGVALTDQNGKLLDTEQIMLNISKRLRELKDLGPQGAQQARWLAGQLGVGSMYNQLLQGPQALAGQLNQAAQMSRVTQESVHNAEELQRQWALMKERFKAAGDAAFEKLEPVLIRLGTKLADYLDSVNWDVVADWLEKMVKNATDFIDEIGGWKAVLIVVGGLLTLKLLSPLIAISAALGRVSAGTGILRGLGTVLAGIDTAALAGVLGIAGMVYSPALGGKKRADGSYEDEVPRPKGSAPGTDAASLWAKVQGRSSAYLGSKSQAALLLSTLFYAGGDKIGGKDLQKTANEILAGRLTPSDLPGGGTAGQVGGSPSALFNGLEKRYGLPAGILQRIYQTESGGGKHLVSPKGALGPFQFMPGTATSLGLSSSDVMDVNKAAPAAAKYLAQLTQMFHGDLNQAVAAYNWGPGNVQRFGLAGAPLETRNYLTSVLGPGRGGTSSAETHIGKIEVYTQATDAPGIARDIGSALRNNMLIAQADTGLN